MKWKLFYKVLYLLPEPHLTLGDLIVCRSQSDLGKNLQELIDLYKQVFGEYDVTAGSIWGEGAYCDKEGRDKKIDINTYRRLSKENRLSCDCGGKYIEFHSSDEVRKRIESNFVDSEYSCCVLKKSNGHIFGFSWGGVFSVRNLTSKINVNLSKKMPNSIYSHLLYGFSYAIFIEEIALSSGFRGNIKNVLALLMPLLEYDGYDSIPVMFRTRKSSNIYRIIKNLDYSEVVLDADYVLISFNNSKKLRKLIKWCYIIEGVSKSKKVKAK